jgi:hypothetical protein
MADSDPKAPVGKYGDDAAAVGEALVTGKTAEALAAPPPPPVRPSESPVLALSPGSPNTPLRIGSSMSRLKSTGSASGS